MLVISNYKCRRHVCLWPNPDISSLSEVLKICMKESHKHPYLSGEDILLFILLSSTEMISCCAPISPLRDITRPNIKQRIDWCNVWLILYLFLHSFLSTSAKYNSNNLVFWSMETFQFSRLLYYFHRLYIQINTTNMFWYTT